MHYRRLASLAAVLSLAGCSTLMTDSAGRQEERGVRTNPWHVAATAGVVAVLLLHLLVW
jgi:hypothetical protein